MTLRRFRRTLRHGAPWRGLFALVVLAGVLSVPTAAGETISVLGEVAALIAGHGGATGAAERSSQVVVRATVEGGLTVAEGRSGPRTGASGGDGAALPAVVPAVETRAAGGRQTPAPLVARGGRRWVWLCVLRL